ncbi:hypothetical protein BVX95_01995 [archaeon D22]|nr:hypothetical protein BVX95_01995 [archaeon D22]
MKLARKRSIFSERLKLIEKSKEATLSAIQIYNNPLTRFKTESFIVLMNIAWTYLLHAYYKSKNIDYRYYEIKNVRKKYKRNPDGTIAYWDLMQCLKETTCPLDEHTINNLKFLIGLRNEIVHRNVPELDSYLSARYQACALNYNYYLKKLHGKEHSLDNNLALSLQFAELDYEQQKVIKDTKNKIPKNIQTYIAGFDKNIGNEGIGNERFSYKLLFVKVNAKRAGQADRVIEFLDPKSELAKTVSKEYWVKEDREKPKYSATQVIAKVKKAGISGFGMYQHTQFWRKHDGKNPSKGFGTNVVKSWFWYQNWIDFIVDELKNE